jgi:predicted cytidylate kinase
MIITISGTPGSGKSTIAELLAKKLGFKHYSAGDFMRTMAEERGITLQELSEISVRERSIDDEIDRRTVDLAKREDNIVIDSRLGWRFVPKAVKILLTVSEDVAAQRIFAARRPDEKYNITLEKTKENMRKRLQTEITRYRNWYALDYTDPKHHDLVIDTSALTPEQIVGKILAFLKKNKKL